MTTDPFARRNSPGNWATGITGSIGSSGMYSDRLHVFVRDPQANGLGNDGMTIQLVDGDYENTGLLNAQFGDYGDIIGRVSYFGPTIQVIPQMVLALNHYSLSGLPDSIVEPDTVTTADLHINTGSGNRIDWTNFVRYNNGYVRLEDVEVTKVDGDVSRPHWLMSSDGGTTELGKDDHSLRFRTGGNYNPPFNKRTGPYTPPSVGVNSNIQGFLVFRGHDPFSTGDPTQAVFAISPWEDADVSVIEEVAVDAEGDPDPVELLDVGLTIDFSELDSDATITVEQFTEVPDDLPGVFVPELGFWSIDIEGPTNFSTDLCFSLDGLDPSVDPTTLQVMKRDSVGGDWVQQNTYLLPDDVNPTQICADDVTSFSDFTVGSFDPEAGDPDELSPYVLLAKELIRTGEGTFAEGDIHSNGDVRIGEESTIDGNVSATGSIQVEQGATVKGGLDDDAAVVTLPIPVLAFSTGGDDVKVKESVPL